MGKLNQAGKERKELHFDPVIIDKLQKLADKKKWKLKLYMEEVLIDNSKKADKL